MKSALLLDAGYTPMDVISYKQAIKMFMLNKVEIVEEYEDELRSAYLVIKIPAVVRLINKVSRRKRKKGVKFSRIGVYARDGFTCFSAGTRVLLSSGKQVDIRDIKKGDEVIDAFGNPTKVVDKRSRWADDCLFLKHRGSFEETTTTPEHPYLNSHEKFVPIKEKPKYLVQPRDIRYNLDNPKLISVADFIQDDKWFRLKNGRIYNTRRSHEHGFPVTLEQSKELAYIIGLYVGDGSADLRGSVSWAFNTAQKKTLVKDVEDFIGKLGLKSWVSKSNKGKGLVIGTCSKVLASFLRHTCGFGGSDRKKTPWGLIGPFHKEYLKGLFCADGYICREKNKVVLSMTSWDVIVSAQSMLWGLGIFPTLQRIKRLEKLDTYSLFLQGENYSKFMNIILNDRVSPKKPAYGNNKFIFRKLEKLSPAGSPTIVYNLETESHSFIANGLAVHNCQYCGAKKASKDFTFDHVVPRSRGGKTNWVNIVTSCVPCNRKKSNRTPAEAGMTLLKEPKEPKWLPVVSIRVSTKSIPEAWSDYLYWTTDISEEPQ